MQAGGYRRDKMRTTKSPTVPLRKTSITDLPPELVSIIFNFVHDSTTPIQLEKDYYSHMDAHGRPRRF